MNVRYQVLVAAVGGELRPEREQLTQEIVTMGHLPIDLIAANMLDQDADSLARHIGRSDYLVWIVSRSDDGPGADAARLEGVYDAAAKHELPMLTLVKSGSRTSEAGPSDVTRLFDKLELYSRNLINSVETLEGSTTLPLNSLFDTYPRPGWVSARDVPGANVASELARLSQENADLRKRVSLAAEAAEQQSFDKIKSELKANKILIPLWIKGTSEWEQPVELNLFDFFVRLAPELVVERSVVEASEFIPIGVCELPAEQQEYPLMVPYHNLNLWLTDLMALGLVTPSPHEHSKKDRNQYWSLTDAGRDFIAEVRRDVLQTGGHRHVGFTSEFRIPEELRRGG